KPMAAAASKLARVTRKNESAQRIDSDSDRPEISKMPRSSDPAGACLGTATQGKATRKIQISSGTRKRYMYARYEPGRSIFIRRVTSRLGGLQDWTGKGRLFCLKEPPCAHSRFLLRNPNSRRRKVGHRRHLSPVPRHTLAPASVLQCAPQALWRSYRCYAIRADLIFTRGSWFAKVVVMSERVRSERSPEQTHDQIRELLDSL